MGDTSDDVSIDVSPRSSRDDDDGFTYLGCYIDEFGDVRRQKSEIRQIYFVIFYTILFVTTVVWFAVMTAPNLGCSNCVNGECTVTGINNATSHVSFVFDANDEQTTRTTEVKNVSDYTVGERMKCSKNNGRFYLNDSHIDKRSVMTRHPFIGWVQAALLIIVLVSGAVFMKRFNKNVSIDRPYILSGFLFVLSIFGSLACLFLLLS